MAVAVGVQQNRFHQLPADGVGRVQGRHRVLEDNRDAIATHGAQQLLVRADQLLPVEFHAAADDFARRRKNLHDGICRDALARTAFAHDAQHLAVVKAERNAIHRLDFARVGEEGCMQVIDFQQCHFVQLLSSRIQLRVKCVAQAVAEQVQAQHDEADDHGGDNQAIGVGIDAVERVRSQRTQRGHRRVDAQPQEG